MSETEKTAHSLPPHWGPEPVDEIPVEQNAEQAARDMLERMGVPDASVYSSGDLIELANLICRDFIKTVDRNRFQTARYFLEQLGILDAQEMTDEQLAALPADAHPTAEPEPERIPGTFTDNNAEAARIKFFKIRPVMMNYPPIGRAIMRRYRANVDDGILVVGVSNDPVKRRADGSTEFSFHISISHRSAIAGPGGDEVLTRCPTYDEIKRAKFQFAPAGMAMALFFPPVENENHAYLNRHATTLHLIEVDASLCF